MLLTDNTHHKLLKCRTNPPTKAYKAIRIFICFRVSTLQPFIYLNNFHTPSILIFNIVYIKVY